MEKKNLNIEAYNGADAYYEGSEKDYEDFLKSVDGNMNTKASATPVGETQKRELGETINIKGVIDMVKKKAGNLQSAAAKVVNDFKTTASEKAEEKPSSPITKETAEEKAAEVKTAISNTARAAKSHLKEAADMAKEKIDEVKPVSIDMSGITDGIADLKDKLNAVESKINEVEVKQIECRNSSDRNTNDLRVSINNLNNELGEVKQSANIIAKLNDSVFDLKNTQQNTKKSLADLESGFIKLKKKVTTGIAVISILSLITIILEIINLLS